MFEVLVYLFENYMDGSITTDMDAGTIINELEEAGFLKSEIGRALDWLEGLHQMQETVFSGPMLNRKALRLYSEEECEILPLATRGFLLYLEQLGILDPMTREIVIDRLMALDLREIDMARVKWVVLIALFSQPDKKAALSLLQDIAFAEAFDVLH